MKQTLVYAFLSGMFLLFISGTNSESSPLFNAGGNYSFSVDSIDIIYNEIFSDPVLDSKVFEIALLKMHELRKTRNLHNDSIITIIDYGKNCNENRLFIIDLKNKDLVKNTMVAHGKNSGIKVANSFSNIPHSHKSSLGSFLTGKTYLGKHGYSLRIDGLEAGLNDKARERAIVIHGANYVSKEFIKKNGRIGRSYGCPALPPDEYKEIIDLIKDQSYLYIYHPLLSDTTRVVQNQKVL